MTDWTLLRSEFPALRGRAYLNTAGGGVMSLRVAAAGRNYYEESLELGDIGWDRWLERSDQDRDDVARFVGADSENIAFLPNASLGLNILARSLEAGSTVLAVDQEFPSCTTPFIRSGCRVEFISTNPDGYVDADMIRSKVLPGVKALVLSSVQFANGFRADLAEIGQVCRENSVLFLVDATQSIGAFPLDMGSDFIDALVFSGYKWATAGYGVAVLATGGAWPSSDPPLIGWRSARNAYALENHRLDLLPSGIGHEMGHPAFPGIFAMGEAVRLLEQADPELTGSRILKTLSVLREGLKARGISIRSNLDPAHQSGIVLAEFEDAGALCQSLRTLDVWTTAREGGLRISVHGYNDITDIERFFEALDGLRSRKG